ncbi:MAG: hypothetical protein HY529_04545 [Chloroflexi bacterium]|nr:hypothetical protein [Chloroflexota bacterium]
MCHLVLLIPLAGIPLFWLLPMEYALPINILLWIVCGWLGYKVIRAMMLAPKDGFKSLVGNEAMVVSIVKQGYSQYIVEAGHELWTARCAEALRLGERVEVTATDGIKLVVARVGPEDRRENK